jgi:cell division protein FtsQ
MQITSADSRQRQRQLRRQGRLRLLVATWRTLAIAGLTGGLLWSTSLSGWLLRGSEQINVRGNHWLSDSAIQDLLPHTYPQVMWKIHPQEIAEGLRQSAPIQTATITRQLFPPQLIVDVQERPPVAITECNRCALLTTVPQPGQTSRSNRQSQNRLQVPVADNVWLIDATGMVAPLSSYPNLQGSDRLPTLKVSGFFTPVTSNTTGSGTNNPSIANLMTKVGGDSAVSIDPNRRAQWVNLLRTLQQSPQKILGVEWQANNHLRLKTDLGPVLLGPYNKSLLAEQLKVLDQMRNLPDQYDLKQLAYIDLSDPKQPLLQRRSSHRPPSPSKP